jgi:hypothetical protein
LIGNFVHSFGSKAPFPNGRCKRSKTRGLETGVGQTPSGKNMNENSQVLRLGTFILNKEGWGARDGRNMRAQLTGQIALHRAGGVVKLSLSGMKRIDVAFAFEAIVGLAAAHGGARPFCVIDLADPDIRANLAAAADQFPFPVMTWNGQQGEALGLRPGSAAHDALAFALARPEVRAAEFSAAAGVSISNASSRFHNLWARGLLLREASMASSGGKEYVYRPVR